MTVETKSIQPLPVLTPELALDVLGVDGAADAMSTILTQTYGGLSDTTEGYSKEKYIREIEEGTLFPFIVMDGKKPVACYSAHWYGANVRMAMAAVLPEYRNGSERAIRGKDLYTIADEWVMQHLASKIAVITGNPRVPESAAIVINHIKRHPFWLTAHASWGRKDQPLSEINDRRHEFLLVSEKYPRGNVFIPKYIHLPTDPGVSSTIQTLWQLFADVIGVDNENISYTAQSSKKDVSLGFLLQERYTHKTIFTAIESSQDLSLKKAVDITFHGDVPARAIFIHVPIKLRNATAVQDTLLSLGFTFCGILPGLAPVEVQIPDGRQEIFSRQPIHLYAALRPGLEKYITPVTMPTMENHQLQEAFETIAASWENNRLFVDQIKE